MSSPSPVNRTVLVTGAAGRIGSAFVAECHDRYGFRLADLHARADVDSATDIRLLDVADLAACREMCQGVDTVVHLAADPSPDADFHDSLLANNITGAYNMFRASKDAGCARVIFASSIHAVGGHPAGDPIPENAPVRPLNMYGVSKAFGEATAHAFARSEGLSTIAIRIGAYHNDWSGAQPPLKTSPHISARAT